MTTMLLDLSQHNWNDKKKGKNSSNFLFIPVIIWIQILLFLVIFYLIENAAKKLRDRYIWFIKWQKKVNSSIIHMTIMIRLVDILEIQDHWLAFWTGLDSAITKQVNWTLSAIIRVQGTGFPSPKHESRIQSFHNCCFHYMETLKIFGENGK